jgi:methyl-accepting chemotaxis protein
MMFNWLLSLVRFRTLAVRVLVPTIAALSIAALGSIAYLTKETRANTIASSVAAAERTIGQFKTLRSYYTKYVVEVAKRAGSLQIGVDHRTKPGVIPLPATMIHDLSAELSAQENGIQLALYSAYPFPNRSSRKLDPFQTEALEFVTNNPGQTFIRTVEMSGGTFVRVAQADVMAAQACVGCHNQHPESPKTDWRLNDVRGVLEVVTPINAEIVRNQLMMSHVQWGLLGTYGALGGMLSLLLYRLGRRMRSLQQAAEAAARGDLTVTLSDSGARDEVGAVTSSFSSMLENLRSLVGGIKTLSMNVEDTTDEMVGGLNQLAQGTENGAAAVHHTSAATEEMTATVKQNAENATRTHELTQQAVKKAGAGADTVAQAVRSMGELSESCRRVSEMVGLVNEIAFTTNILALNAAVEAARAGDQGRGFSVVATEVRRLSARTASAAAEIQKLVRDSNEKTQDAQKLVEQSGRVFEEINEAVSAVTHNASEIAAACREQSTGIQEVNSAVVAMNQLIQTSTAMITQSTTVAEELRREAHSLASVVSRFNVGDGEVPDTQLRKPAHASPARHSGREPPPEPALEPASETSEQELAEAVVRDFFESLEPPSDRTRRRN